MHKISTQMCLYSCIDQRGIGLVSFQWKFLFFSIIWGVFLDVVILGVWTIKWDLMTSRLLFRLRKNWVDGWMDVSVKIVIPETSTSQMSGMSRVESDALTEPLFCLRLIPVTTWMAGSKKWRTSWKHACWTRWQSSSPKSPRCLCYTLLLLPLRLK